MGGKIGLDLLIQTALGGHKINSIRVVEVAAPPDNSGLDIVHRRRMALNPDVALLEKGDDLPFQSSDVVDAWTMHPKSELDFFAGSDGSVEVGFNFFVSPVFQKLSRGENQTGFAGHELDWTFGGGYAVVEKGSERD